MNLDNWHIFADSWVVEDYKWHRQFYVAYHVRGYEPCFFEFDQQTIGMDGVE